ncbi:MAG: rod shape-determining protein MreC, partial [Oxalobacteraceae bacterium]
ANADIQKGDLLTTSGIDGIYPAGLSVARVVQVENKSNDAFERVTCQPLAGIDRNKQFLILLAQVKDQIQAPPAVVKGKPDKASRQRTAENAKKVAAGAAVAPKSPERTR